jgi:hypothetical protein
LSAQRQLRATLSIQPPVPGYSQIFETKRAEGPVYPTIAGPPPGPRFRQSQVASANGTPFLVASGVYERLERIPANPLQWKVKPRDALRLAATLVSRRDEAFLYRQLATLIDTVPLEGSLEDLRFHGVARGRFERWCDNLGVVRLKTAPRRWH